MSPYQNVAQLLAEDRFGEGVKLHVKTNGDGFLAWVETGVDFEREEHIVVALGQGETPDSAWRSLVQAFTSDEDGAVPSSQAALILGVSRETIANMLKSGRLELARPVPDVKHGPDAQRHYSPQSVWRVLMRRTKQS